MQPVEIAASGMVTAVGLTAPAACAAIRAGISRVQEMPFIVGDEPLFGAAVPLGGTDATREKLLHMVSLAVGECLAEVEAPPEEKALIPIVLCLPEPGRPGRIEGLDRRFLTELRRGLKLDPVNQGPDLLELGRAGGVQGIAEAARLLASDDVSACIIAAVDSLLTAETLTAYHQQGRLKTDENSNGFIPGEAAAAVLVTRPAQGGLRCLGLGMGSEPAPIDSEKPLRAEGLFQAIRSAFRAGNCSYADVDYRICDVNGEHYGFKEASLAVARTLRETKDSFKMWHPADCIGDVGAAIGPATFAIALAAARKGYGPGPGVLCHFASDGSERSALVLRLD